MIDLDEKYINFIKKTVSSVLGDYKLYIFGSRVKGRAKEYSDIDIAIDSEELSSANKSKLEALFENSTIPYEVDIVDLNNITETFKNIIKSDLVKLT